MKEYLTEQEIASVENFCSNTAMYEAVKKVILAGIYTNGVITKGELHRVGKNFLLALVQDNMSDEQLGQELRASHSAVSLLENAFNELNNIKSEKLVESPFNEAI